MKTEHEMKVVDQNELRAVEGGTDVAPIPTPASQKAIDAFLAILDHAIAAAKKA